MAVIIKQVSSASSPAEAHAYINAFLRLFNDPENRKFLSFTGVPFKRETVEAWFYGAEEANVAYYTAVGSDDEICAIMSTKADSIEGFVIMALVVDAACRRMGVGSRLVETAVHLAEEKGFRAVSVAVFADNKRMLSLLLEKGFKPCRIEYHTRWDGEDIVYLQKIL